ncbi:MAG: response regulator [Alphaproteobacteria bacterium]|nr:response regulator [Alphaproteobacteria bacterium]
MTIADGKVRILIVDDSQDSAMTLGWLVEMMDADYRLAHSGDEAIKTASEYIPNLVLMDIGLPGMSGYDVCKKMKEMPALANTVFAAQTGWGEEQHRRASKEAGFDHHLVKPVSIDSLQDLLTSIKAQK